MAKDIFNYTSLKHVTDLIDDARAKLSNIIKDIQKSKKTVKRGSTKRSAIVEQNDVFEDTTNSIVNSLDDNERLIDSISSSLASFSAAMRKISDGSLEPQLVSVESQEGGAVGTIGSTRSASRSNSRNTENNNNNSAMTKTVFRTLTRTAMSAWNFCTEHLNYSSVKERVDDVLEIVADKQNSTIEFRNRCESYGENLTWGMQAYLSGINNSVYANNDGKDLYVNHSDIVTFFTNVSFFSDLNFDGSTSEELSHLLFARRTAEQENRFRQIVTSNNNINVTPETFENEMYRVFCNSLGNVQGMALMTNVNTEYHNKPMIPDKKNNIVEGKFYTFDEIQNSDMSYMLDEQNFTQLDLKDNADTKYAIISGKIVVSSFQNMQNEVNDALSISRFYNNHIIRLSGMSKDDFLSAKYGMAFNGSLGGSSPNSSFLWQYDSNIITEDIVNSTLDTFDSETKAGYSRLLNSEYDDEQINALNTITSLYVNDLILSEDITNDEQGILDLCVNMAGSMTASDLRNYVHEYEFGEQDVNLINKYSGYFDSLQFQNSEIVKTLLFRKDLSLEEGLVLATSGSRLFNTTITNPLTGETTDFSLVSASDFNNFVNSMEYSDVSFDYAKGTMTIASQKYTGIDDWYSTIYGGSPSKTSTETYDISDIVDIQDRNDAIMGMVQLLNGVDTSAIKGKENITFEEIQDVFGENVENNLGFGSKDFNTLYTEDATNAEGYKKSDLAIALTIVLKQQGIDINNDVENLINGYSTSKDIEQIDSFNLGKKAIGLVTFVDAQNMILQAAKGAATFGENIADAFAFAKLDHSEMLDESINDLVNTENNNYLYNKINNDRDGINSDILTNKYYEPLSELFNMSATIGKNNVGIDENTTIEDVFRMFLGKEKTVAEEELFRNITNSDGKSASLIENLIIYNENEMDPYYYERFANNMKKNYDENQIFDTEKVEERNRKLQEIATPRIEEFFEKYIYNSDTAFGMSYGEYIDKTSLLGGRDGLASKVAFTTGNMLPIVAIRLALASGGVDPRLICEALFWASNYGSNVQEAINMGCTNIEEINNYAKIQASVSSLVEHFSPGGSISDNTILGKVFEKYGIGNFARTIFSAVGESSEELTEYFLKPFVVYLSGIDDKDLQALMNQQYSVDSALETVSVAFLSSLLLQTIVNVGSNEQKIVDYSALTPEQQAMITEIEYNNLIEYYKNIPENIRESADTAVDNGLMQIVNNSSNSSNSSLNNNLVSSGFNSNSFASNVFDAIGKIDSGMSVEEAYSTLSESLKNQMTLSQFQNMVTECRGIFENAKNSNLTNNAVPRNYNSGNVASNVLSAIGKIDSGMSVEEAYSTLSESLKNQMTLSQFQNMVTECRGIFEKAKNVGLIKASDTASYQFKIKDIESIIGQASLKIENYLHDILYGRINKSFPISVEVSMALKNIKKICGSDSSFFAEMRTKVEEAFAQKINEQMESYVDTLLSTYLTQNIDDFINDNIKLSSMILRTEDFINHSISQCASMLNNNLFSIADFTKHINEKIEKNLNEKAAVKSQIKQILNDKFGNYFDKLLTFTVNGERVTLNGKNIVRNFLEKGWQFNESINFENVDLDKLIVVPVSKFLHAVGGNQDFGMNQGTFKKAFGYVTKSGILKYKNVIYEYFKIKFPERAEKIIAALDKAFANCYVNQYQYKYIVDALIVKCGKDSAKQILDDNFTLAKTEDIEVSNLIQKLGDNGFDVVDANKLISIIDSVGVCSYTAFGNLIISSFRDYPVLFKKYFGFSLFNEDGSLNERELLLDMYIDINKMSNGGILIDDSSGKPKILSFDEKDIIYLSKGCEPINVVFIKYLKRKGIKGININVKNIPIFKHQYDISEEIINGLLDNMLIKIGCIKGVAIYPVNSNEKPRILGGSHAMFVTGIDKEKVYVSSWGKECYIKLEDLNNGNCGFGMVKLEYDEKLTPEEQIENDSDLAVYTWDKLGIKRLIDTKRIYDENAEEIDGILERIIEKYTELSNNKIIKYMKIENLPYVINNIMNDNRCDEWIKEMRANFTLCVPIPEIVEKVLENTKVSCVKRMRDLLEDTKNNNNFSDSDRDIIDAAISKLDGIIKNYKAE